MRVTKKRMYAWNFHRTNRMMISRTTQAMVTPTMTPVERPEELEGVSPLKDWSQEVPETSITLISLYCTFKAEPTYNGKYAIENVCMCVCSYQKQR
jgi:hypothetical protein